MPKKTIFISSCNGYLGSSLYEFLRNKNFRILRGSRSKSSNSDLEINNWKKDIKKIFKNKIDIVIYTTGLNRDSVDNIILKRDIHQKNLEEMIKESIKSGVKYFIYLSTIHVFKYQNNRSFKFDSKQNNLSPYALAHIASEKILSRYHKKNFKPIIVRVSNCFGFSKKMSKFTDKLFIHQLIRSFINQNHFHVESHYQTKINFCPLSVFNELIYELIIKKRKSKIYNLGVSKKFSLKDIVELISKKIKLKGIQNFSYSFNNKNKIPKSLNIKFNLSRNISKINFNKEILRLIDYYHNLK